MYFGVELECGVELHDGWKAKFDSEEELMDALNRRAQPVNEPLKLRFGSGDIGVSTCRQENSDTWNELLLWNPHMRQDIGDLIPIAEGTTTDDVEVFARLIFLNADSAQVVSDALNRIIDSSGGNRPLTLEQLRGMDGVPVWIEVDGRPDLNKYCMVRRTDIGVIAIGAAATTVYGDDGQLVFEAGTYYDIERGNLYGVTWLAYRRKPERGGCNL